MTRQSMDPDSDDYDDDARLGRVLSSEVSPLLLQDDDPATAAPISDAVEEEEEERARLRPTVVVLTIIIIFLAEVAVNVAVPAMNAVMEAIICDQLHPGVTVGLPSVPGLGSSLGGHGSGGPLRNSPPGSSVCKSQDVQSYLVLVRGWSQTFETIPTVLCSLAYGILADRWGRRPVLLLSALGLNLHLLFTYAVFVFSAFVPIWSVWFANLFYFIGGGGMVAAAMLYTFLSDVVSVEHRSTVFFQFGAAFLTAQTISTPLSGFLMLYSPWLPLVVSWVLMTITNLISLLMPETVHLHNHAREMERRSSGDLDDRSVSGDGVLGVGRLKSSAIEELKDKTIDGLMEVWQFVLGNKKIGFMMLSLVFVVLGKLANELLLQYATKRYGWTWSEAAFLMTISGVTSMFTLLVVLPVGGWFFIKYCGLTGVFKDLWLIRATSMVLIFGCLVIALASNGVVLAFGLVPYAFGSGLSPLIRSVLSALVEEHHIAMLNSLIGITESVGVMTASPLLAMSLSLGLKLGDGWIGLPFLLAAMFATVVSLIAWTFRPPNKVDQTSAEP